MNTKTLALIIAFAALTIILNTIRIPTIYWPGFYYRVYEIPIVVAFLLFGFKVGVSVSILNLLGQIVFFPVPGGIAAYPFGLIAILVMISGVYLANILTKKGISPTGTREARRIIIYSTTLAIVLRVLIMTLLDYNLLYHVLLPLALGRTFTESFIIALVPSMVVFNATVPLYTIPISYFVAKKASKSIEKSTS